MDENPPPPVAPIPPIPIKAHTDMGNWLRKRVLIGETHSFDHITNIPSSLIHGDHISLNIGIDIGCSMSSKVFIEDKSSWSDWFKWLIPGEKHNTHFERLAWMKIIGLPLELWDESTFSTIVSRFGRVTHPFDNISTRRDYFMGKVGIITTSKRWINEKVTVSAGGTIFRVGVVEYTDDWSPFTPMPFDKTVESDEEDDKYETDDEDVVSETWMQEDKE